MSGIREASVSVAAVRIQYAGAVLVGDHASGVSELLVDDAFEFNEGTGELLIGGDTLAYTGWDDETNTISLAAPTTSAYDDDDQVRLLPSTPIKVADVVDIDGASMPALVWHTLDPLLREGIREPNEQETGTIFYSGDYEKVWLVNCPGKVAAIDPASIATSGGDIDPPALAVGETAFIALESPDGYGSYDTNPNFYSSYVGQFQDVGEVKLLPNGAGDLDPAFPCYVVTKTRFESTGTAGEYELLYRYFDYSVPPDPGPGTVLTCPLYDITDLLEVGGTYGWVGQARFDNAWTESDTNLAFDAYSGPSNSSSDEGDGYWSSDPDGVGVWTDIAPGYGPDDPPTNYGNFTYTGGRYGFQMHDLAGGYLFDTTPPDDTLVDASGQWFIRGFGIKRVG